MVIVGGGPAGMMAGLLFARAGISTAVLEKHADFFRDFRGGTVHPSTMEVLDQLGMLGRFLERPHDKVYGAQIRIAGQDYWIGDLSHLDTPAPFIAMMPQWDFLDFLRDEAAAFSSFQLELEAEATGFVEHLKLPHYVDFQSELQNIRRLREAVERGQDLAEAAE